MLLDFGVSGAKIMNPNYPLGFVGAALAAICLKFVALVPAWGEAAPIGTLFCSNLANGQSGMKALTTIRQRVAAKRKDFEHYLNKVPDVAVELDDERPKLKRKQVKQ